MKTSTVLTAEVAKKIIDNVQSFSESQMAKMDAVLIKHINNYNDSLLNRPFWKFWDRRQPVDLETIKEHAFVQTIETLKNSGELRPLTCGFLTRIKASLINKEDCLAVLLNKCSQVVETGEEVVISDMYVQFEFEFWKKSFSDFSHHEEEIREYLEMSARFALLNLLMR